jgi:signal transduction histidine kinase
MSTLLAHEIRNPLGSMELFAGLLAEAELSRESRRWLDHLRAGLRTLAATVNNVLQFHSLPQPELARTSVGELLRGSVDFLRPLAMQAGVRMELQNRAEDVWIAADPHRLQQVLLNLALNAFRFLPEGGLLLISGTVISDVGRNFAQLELADSGPGIAVENLARIFEPGFTTRQGSPGLGLAVCKKIVEQHGGTIAVASQPGCGARFTLRFPRIGAAA